MPVEFLTDEQAATYGRFLVGLTPAELEGIFFLDHVDRDLDAAGHIFRLLLEMPQPAARAFTPVGVAAAPQAEGLFVRG